MVEMVQRLRSGRWVRDRLDEFLWSKQRGIAKSIVRNRYTVIKSSRDTGKSFTAARMAVLARGARELIGPLWGSSDLSMGDGWTATGVLIKA